MKQAQRLVAGLFALSLLGLAAEAQASPYPLDQILPEAAAKKAEATGVKTSDDLLAKGAKAGDRRKLAKSMQIDIKQITEWVRLCDLVRLNGVGPIMAKLLLAAKIDSVPKLKTQKAKAFYPRLIKINDKLKITENPPSEQYVADWIEQAKKLKPMVR